MILKVEDLKLGMIIFVPNVNEWLRITSVGRSVWGHINIYLDVSDDYRWNYISSYPGDTFKVIPESFKVML
jgi:hypothetical protein